MGLGEGRLLGELGGGGGEGGRVLSRSRSHGRERKEEGLIGEGEEEGFRTPLIEFGGVVRLRQVVRYRVL